MPPRLKSKTSWLTATSVHRQPPQRYAINPLGLQQVFTARKGTMITPHGAQILPRAGQVNIQQQNITVASGYRSETEGILTPIPGSTHTRNRRKYPPDAICVAGTRWDVIRKILTWGGGDIEPGERNTRVRPIYWLHGPVGCGKSAVAQTVAEELEQRHRPVASFFFHSSGRNKMSGFATTIADQLVKAIPKTRRFVEAALANPLLRSSSAVIQFQALVLQPIQKVFDQKASCTSALSCIPTGRIPNRLPAVVIADGIDECPDVKDVLEVVADIIKTFEENPYIPLRFLITSRTEEHFRKALLKCVAVIHPLSTPTRDIATFVHHSFDNIAKDPVIRTFIQERGAIQWPSQPDLDLLIELVDRHFIVTQAHLQFILEPEGPDDGRTPIDRFEEALKFPRSSGIDGLYRETLHRAMNCKDFEVILTSIALLAKPLSILELATLLDIPQFRITDILVKLQSIIQFQPDDDGHGSRDPITPFHRSFLEFLRTESRSGAFFANPSYHERLASRCLDLLGGPLHETNLGAREYAAEHLMSHYNAYLDLRLPASRDDDARNAAWAHVEHLSCAILQSPASPLRDSYIGIFNCLMLDSTKLFHRLYERGPATFALWRELAAFRGLERPKDHVLDCIIALALRNPIYVQRELRTRFFSKHPTWFCAANHTALVLDGIDLFLRSNQSRFAHKYMFLHWVEHLENAVAGDPTITPAFLNAHRILPVAQFDQRQLKFEQRLRPGDMRNLRRSAMSALAAVNTKIPGVFDELPNAPPKTHVSIAQFLRVFHAFSTLDDCNSAFDFARNNENDADRLILSRMARPSSAPQYHSCPEGDVSGASALALAGDPPARTRPKPSQKGSPLDVGSHTAGLTVEASVSEEGCTTFWCRIEWVRRRASRLEHQLDMVEEEWLSGPRMYCC